MKRFTFLATLTAPLWWMFRKKSFISKESEKLYSIRYTIGHGPMWDWGEKDQVSEECKEAYEKNLTSLVESLKWQGLIH